MWTINIGSQCLNENRKGKVVQGCDVSVCVCVD